MQDAIHAKGIFRVRVYENGNLIEDYEDANVIVVLGRQNIVRLLGGHVDGRSLTQIGFGEGTAPATSTDTALTSSFVKAVGAVSYPTSTSVKFDWTLENAEANGKQITEFGLLNVMTVLFSRKQRSVINKTSSIKLIGDWTIQL